MLLNWHVAWQATSSVRLFANLLNMCDTPYAERANYVFGDYRYFPGMPKQTHFGVDVVRKNR